MKKRLKLGFFTVLIIGLVTAGIILLKDNTFVVVQTKGTIADSQRNLLVIASLLSLIVVVPVLILTFYIAWKYREKNTKAVYQPDWDHSRAAETVWWGVPIILILILSGIIWKSSHMLDPSKPIASSVKPIRIQAIALQWKWLFIYPDYNIATVNYIQFPEKTPLNFELTADAPMNSFWIPQLGGQVYAMSGMQTSLHLMANEQGRFNGSSANLSGEGFAGMKFIAEARSANDFEQWIVSVKQSQNTLGTREYASLVKPSKDNPAYLYAYIDRDLYGTVVGKYMMHGSPLHKSELQGTGHVPSHNK